MSDKSLTDEQLAMLLQACRDFAFGQIAARQPLLPYVTVARTDGEVTHVRFAESGAAHTPDELLALTEREVAQEAAKGDLVAVAIASAVKLHQPQDGWEDALRIHLEAPGFARQFLAYYAFAAGDASVSPGKLVPFDVEAKVFTN